MSLGCHRGKPVFLTAALAVALAVASCTTAEPKALPAGTAHAPAGAVEAAPVLTPVEVRARALAEAARIAAEATGTDLVEKPVGEPAGEGRPPSLDASEPAAPLPAPAVTAGAAPAGETALDEEHLKSIFEAERGIEFEQVQQRIFYPDELFGAPMIRKDDLGAGMVIFYYPLRSVGAVSADLVEMKIKVKGPDGKGVAKLVEFLTQYLDTSGSPKEEVKHYPNLNMLQITAKEENMPFILDVLDFLDSPKQQVVIEAAVWEITEAEDLQLGAEVKVARHEKGKGFFEMFTSTHDAQAFVNALTAGKPFQGSTIEFVNTADGHEAKMDVVLQFVQSRGYADLVAQPRMRVSAGEVARIVTGEQIPFHYKLKAAPRADISVEYRTVGVQLEVMPMLVGQGFIEVALAPSVSEVSGYIEAGVAGVSNPIIVTRQASTKVVVANNELITIGGLDQTRKTITERKVPILGDIPLIKYLFRSSRESTKKVQVWFTVRPTIGGESGRIIVPELTGMRPGGRVLPK